MKEIILTHPYLSFFAFCFVCHIVGWIITTYINAAEEEREDRKYVEDSDYGDEEEI
jgi:hypothetical protein